MTTASQPIALTVLIPIHQEGQTITKVLAGLKDVLDIAHEILLIYDDFADTSLTLVRDMQPNYPGLHLLHNTWGFGAGGALATGLQQAQGRYIIFLVADDLGPINLVPAMLKYMEQGHDLTAVSRYAKGGKNLGGTCWSRFLSACGNRLFCLLTHSPFSDATNGIKMFRRDLLKNIPLNPCHGWGMAFELGIWAQYYRLKVVELPLISYNRLEGGSSNFKTLPRLLEYSLIFIWGVLKLWKKRILWLPTA